MKESFATLVEVYSSQNTNHFQDSEEKLVIFATLIAVLYRSQELAH